MARTSLRRSSGVRIVSFTFVIGLLLVSSDPPGQANVEVAPGQVSGQPTEVIKFVGPVGSAADPKTWAPELGGDGWGNDELETYTARRSNSALDGRGHLVITARRETFTGTDGIPRDYTSAKLTTEGKYKVQPGSYVEAAIVAPVGVGIWPAFWLVGADFRQVGWPAAGELDVMEGDRAQPDLVHVAAHMAQADDPHRDAPTSWGDPGGTIDLGAPANQRAHLYGVYFDAQSVRFYVDRKERMVLLAADAIKDGRRWPFAEPEHILLNVAIGGGDPAQTSFPQSMTVGPISVWAGGIPF